MFTVRASFFTDVSLTDLESELQTPHFKEEAYGDRSEQVGRADP